ncbi:hypothetical protein F4802DRAFT_609200 [Xylaria palmicola]|nr:hypothetical protein F4802DRAFT_609200 [Xylaria palmicola]
MATITNSNVRLLTVLVDSNDEEESEYRFLVDEEHVKYVTVDPGVFPKDDRTFAPVLIPMLPPFPPGKWNEGHISKDPFTGHPVFSRVTHSDLPGIRNTWYDRRVDHLELKKLDRVRQNIHHVTCPAFDSPVLIEGKGIGTKFLGHLTEAGRVFGFVMENLDGARTAEPQDLTACQRILAKLHALGIKHGDINKHNFLIRNGEAVLVDFETAQKCSEKAELESEYRQLELSLRDPSRRVAIPQKVAGPRSS